MKKKSFFINLNLIIKILIIFGCFIAMVIILSKLRCTKCPECPDYGDPKIIRDTIPGDSVPYPVKTKVPYPVYRDTGSVQWRDRPVDTMAILQDYFSRYFYTDTITDDSSFRAIILDSISQNKIVNRRFYYQNLRPKIVNTTYTYNPKSKPARLVYAGLGISGSRYEFLSFGPELGYKDRKDRLYILQNNFLAKQPNFGLNYLLPIRFKRN